MPFELTILGSSSALPTSERYPTAQVLNILGRFFLIDCGEGTQIQLRKKKISFSKIKHIFISHLHGDHYYGLIGLISTMNLLGIKGDLHIYAPSELKNLLQPQLDFIKSGLKIKLIYHPLNFKRQQVIFSDRNVEVSSFPLKHSIPTCGFIFKEKPKPANLKKDAIEFYKIPIANRQAIKAGQDFVRPDGSVIPHSKLTIPPPPVRSYAFCTDTSYQENIVPYIKDVDLLYHEATFPDEMKDFAAKTLHSTAREAAQIANLANAKKLLIGHFSARYYDVSIFRKEAQEVFPNTDCAKDGASYKV